MAPTTTHEQTTDDSCNCKECCDRRQRQQEADARAPGRTSKCKNTCVCNECLETDSYIDQCLLGMEVERTALRDRLAHAERERGEALNMVNSRDDIVREQAARLLERDRVIAKLETRVASAETRAATSEEEVAQANLDFHHLAKDHKRVLRMLAALRRALKEVL